VISLHERVPAVQVGLGSRQKVRRRGGRWAADYCSGWAANEDCGHRAAVV